VKFVAVMPFGFDLVVDTSDWTPWFRRGRRGSLVRPHELRYAVGAKRLWYETLRREIALGYEACVSSVPLEESSRKDGPAARWKALGRIAEGEQRVFDPGDSAAERSKTIDAVKSARLALELSPVQRRYALEV